MLPPRTGLDPEHYYQRLGLEPAATHADIVAAFRRRARVLHPDVPATGDASAFVAVKQAYDVLSDPQQRAAYDRKAQEATWRAAQARRPDPPRRTAAAADAEVWDFEMWDPEDDEPRVIHPEATRARSPAAAAPVGRRQKSRPFAVPAALGVVLAALLCFSIYQALAHLLTPARGVSDNIPPNAPTVAPLSPSAHQAVLYGVAPVQLAGTPDFYVAPVSKPVVLWHLDAEHKGLVPQGQLPPFSGVQVIRLVRQNGMLEVRVTEHDSGFINADQLIPGDVAAARRAYCSYNAGPAPYDGELLERHGGVGEGTILLENRAVQPAVVKLRDASGAVALSVFLGPGGHAVFDGLPAGSYHMEFAIGELWSRACNSFAAGMRARRVEAAMTMPESAPLVVVSDAAVPAAQDIPDEAFERK